MTSEAAIPNEATVGVFESEDRANRTVRWLRRSGLNPRKVSAGEAFEIVVPSGPEEQQALQVLHALEHTHERPEPAKPTGWGWVRSRLLNIESIGMVVAVVVGAVLLVFVGLWLWALVGMLGWLALIVVLMAGFVFFHFSGIPHSAVKSPRPYSHKHDITMREEQEVQYRLAWARDQYRRSRRRKRLDRRKDRDA